MDVKTFFRNIFIHFKPRIVTTILAILLVIIGLLQLLNPVLNENITELFTKTFEMTFQQHEYYRWLTSSLIHVNVKHFMDTVPMLIVMGFFVEGIVGSWYYLFWLLTTCFCSNILTDYDYLKINEVIPSPGSSNIYYGLAAACVILTLIQGISAKKNAKGPIKEEIDNNLESVFVYCYMAFFGSVCVVVSIMQKIQFVKYVSSADYIDTTKISSPAHFWSVIVGSVFLLLVYLVKCILDKRKVKTNN